jgi:hypothetical protein
MVIENHLLPSWEAVFHLIGEPQPRRGRARCPIHNGDSPTSLSLSERKGVYHCHVCHTSGDKLDFIQRGMNVSFASALSILGIKAGKRPTPDPAIVREREAMRKIRDWCRQVGKKMRNEYLNRQRIEHYAKQKLAADPESPLGWELLRIAYEGEAKNEFLLDEISLCRTDDERLHAWREYHNEF